MLRSIIWVAIIFAISFGIPSLMLRNIYVWSKARLLLRLITGAAYSDGLTWAIWSLIILSILLGGALTAVYFVGICIASHIWAIVIGPVEK